MTGTQLPTDSTYARTPDGEATGAFGRKPRRSGRPRRWADLAWVLTRRAILRPRLALQLLRTVWAFRRRHWYRMPPFLPIPPREYIRWRMYTAYGDADAVPPPSDVVRFARWRRDVMHL